MKRRHLPHVLSRLAGGCTVLGLTAMWWSQNESEVLRLADRLDRIQCSSQKLPEPVPRTLVTDTEALSLLSKPLVISGMIDAWPAHNKWSFENLRARIGHAQMDCGSASSDLTLPFYLVAYNATQRKRGRHDIGLYVFDANFSPESGKAELLEDFSPLLALSGGDIFCKGEAEEHRDRPAFRWLLVGPPGSGTCLHQDPWQYSSWNASVVGRKKWVLFPPSTPFDLLHPPRESDECDAKAGRVAAFLQQLSAWYYRALAIVFNIKEVPRSACEFMDEVLPTLRNRGLGEVEFIQHPGEVVAFPAGWWHAVVNLDATIAVTESFGLERDVPEIVAALKDGGMLQLAKVIESESEAAS